MEKHNPFRALLVEILIAVLFFALSAPVLLEVFVGARNQSVRAEVTNQALLAAQNLADRLYVAETAEDILRQAGFTEAGEDWTLEADGCALTVTLEEKRFPGGLLRSAGITAQYGGETLFTLPCARYLPEEVAP